MKAVIQIFHKYDVIVPTLSPDVGIVYMCALCMTFIIIQISIEQHFNADNLLIQGFINVFKNFLADST